MNTWSHSRILLDFVNSLRSLYGHFWPTSDGYYYCKKQKCTLAVIRVRNKRTTESIPLMEIINDKDYLKELHPVDACILGVLANNDRNGIIDNSIIGWKKMNRSKEYNCFVKSEPILEISRKYTNALGVDIVALHSKLLHREIEVSMLDLCRNQALLYALDSHQAIAIGYDISEFYVRNSH
jgi:hypothetical protein